MRSVLSFSFFIVAVFFSRHACAQAVSAFAGTGTGGYSGDGGVCTTSQLNSCTGIAFDGAGNVYIADKGNNVVRKVSASGTISTFAGTGVTGYSGDGGTATFARLSRPVGVAVDGSGNVFISDNGNNVIRRVSAAGIITTYAGIGAAGYSGDHGPASTARMNSPEGIAIDNTGNLYIADGGNNAIRKISAAGGIKTLAGTGIAGYSGDEGPGTAAQLNMPAAVAVDAAGKVYVADYFNQAIRRIDTSDTIHTIAGVGVLGYTGDGGPATAAALRFPSGVAVLAFNTVYIADQGNNVVRVIDNATGNISTYAGTGISGYSGDGGPAIMAQFSAPKGVSVDGANRVYVADNGNNAVRVVGTTAGIGRIACNTIAAQSLYPYPDPAVGHFSVDVPPTPDPALLTVTDLVGRVIATQAIPATQRPSALTFSSIPPGHYFLKVSGPSISGTGRVQVH